MAGPMSSATRPHAERENGRDDGRDYIRVRPREPHEKYYVPTSEMKPGFDYFLAATAVRGMPNPRFNEYTRAGWKPARAGDHPAMSGIDLQHDPALVEMGIVKEVKPDGLVHVDNLLLMMRPKAMSQESRAEEEKRANRQINDHLSTLRNKSNRAIGEKNTRVSRQYGPADEAPSDADVEMA